MSCLQFSPISRVATRSLTCAETKSGRGPASAKKPTWLTDVTIASTCQIVSCVLQQTCDIGSQSLPLNGLHTTARYPTVNSARPLPGRIRPSEMLNVSIMVIMKYLPVHVPSTSFKSFPVTSSCIFLPKYEGCSVTCLSRL